MPEVTDAEIKGIVVMLQDAILNEKYTEAIASLAELVKNKLSTESPEEQQRIIAKFIKDANAVRSAFVMRPALATGRTINKTRVKEVERHAKLDFLLNCGGAIWGEGFTGSSSPGKLLALLSTLAPESKEEYAYKPKRGGMGGAA